MLSVIPETDRNLQPYLEPSAIWSTVTPVVLPFAPPGATARASLLRTFRSFP